MSYPASLIAFAFVKKASMKESLWRKWSYKSWYISLRKAPILPKYSKPLINETFQAWMYGPVIPEIYNDFKLYGSRPIVDTNEFLSLHYAYKPPFRLDADALDTIDYTWAFCKKISPPCRLSNGPTSPIGPVKSIWPQYKRYHYTNNDIKLLSKNC